MFPVAQREGLDGHHRDPIAEEFGLDAPGRPESHPIATSALVGLRIYRLKEKIAERILGIEPSELKEADVIESEPDEGVMREDVEALCIHFIGHTEDMDSRLKIGAVAACAVEEHRMHFSIMERRPLTKHLREGARVLDELAFVHPQQCVAS